MSEETARKFERARAAEADQRAVTDQVKRDCVEWVAREMPDRLTAYAKRLSHDQPDVAKALGQGGINALRAQLTEAANEIGSELCAGIEEIPWPGAAAGERFDSGGVHSGLFKFLYGERVNRITRIFKDHGFKFDPTGGVLPQDLYDQNSFQAVAAALHAQKLAEIDTAAAKAADDRDTVESLWNE